MGDGRVGGRLEARMRRLTSARGGSTRQLPVARVRAPHGYARAVVRHLHRPETGSLTVATGVDRCFSPSARSLPGHLPRRSSTSLSTWGVLHLTSVADG
ncbi:hypothetical protein [Streptomyces sp. NPDC000618]|uniref:hypothetical protein n=1 Tax=Streptomyces sp. NPDC000618 TaxID=3154265 RepID=UPI00331A41A8